jgi:PAS domain-containing protein
LIAGNVKPVEYFENPILTMNNQERMIAWHNAVLREENGSINATLSSGKNVTQRKQVEKALQESEVRYKGIVEHTINGVAVYRAENDGEDFVFLDFNSTAERIEKIERDEIICRRVAEVFPSVREFVLLEVMKRVWASGEPEHHPISLYKDHRIAGWRENFVYKLPSGEIVAVYSDETTRKQAEEELRQAHDELHFLNQELERKLQERTEELQKKNRALVEAERLAALVKMANRVAHELRNPLTMVGGLSRRLYEKIPDDDPNKRYLRIMVEEDHASGRQSLSIHKD